MNDIIRIEIREDSMDYFISKESGEQFKIDESNREHTQLEF